MYSQRAVSNNALTTTTTTTSASNRYIITTTSDSFGNIGGPTPTPTTPTLTPTTLKNIEESIMELHGIPPAPLEHQHQAGFVPPIVNISSSYTGAAMHSSILNHNSINDNNHNISSSHSNDGQSELDYASDDLDTMTDDSSSQSNATFMSYVSRNNETMNGVKNGKMLTNNGRKTSTSGRKPRNDKLTPEEELKRQQRRERNKQAAARCRKRRLDHTNNLLRETDGLEEKKLALQTEIEQLKSQKEELEFILHTHKTNCKLAAKVSTQQHNINNNNVSVIDIKPNVCNGSVITVATNLSTKSRPTSLPVSCVYATNQDNYKNNNNETNNNNTSNNNNNSETGIPIQTPSNGLFFESMMEGGTGLTPILNHLTPSSLSLSLTPSSTLNTPITSTTCASQQRNSSVQPNCNEISSPDSVKLVPL